MLTSALFIDEYMVKEDLILDARAFFGKLAAKLTTKEALKALVMDFLFKRFIETRNSSLNANQRLAFVR